MNFERMTKKNRNLLHSDMALIHEEQMFAAIVRVRGKFTPFLWENRHIVEAHVSAVVEYVLVRKKYVRINEMLWKEFVFLERKRVRWFVTNGIRKSNA